MMKKKDEMHPDDVRNLFIFFILSITVYFLYDHFVAQPQAEAFRQAQEVQMAQMDSVDVPGGIEAEKVLERSDVLTENARISLDNGQIFGSISLKGGRIDDIGFSNHFETLEKEKNVVLLSPKSTKFPRYVDYGWVASANAKSMAVPGSETSWQVQGNQTLTTGTPVTLFWNNGQGLRFERRMEIDDGYVFKVTQSITNNSGKDVTLHPFGLVTQTGLPEDYQGRFILHEGPIGYVGDKLFEVPYKKLKKEPSQVQQGDKGWIGITDKYWLTTLIPAQGQNVKYRFNYVPSKADPKKGRYQVDFLGAGVTIAPGNRGETTSHLFTGVKEVIKLEEYEDKLGIPHFDLAVDFGMFYFMTKPFFYILHFLGEKIGNLGIAIIILTFMLRMSVFPLTNTSYRSFAKMKKVSPQIVELREKHGTDKVALQQELVKLYEREGVNPMAGCFPILIQIPIFFAFYKVLFATIEVRHAPFFGWIQDLSAPDPTSVFNLFGALPYDVPAFLQIGVWPCIMLVAMIFQKKLNPPPQDALQRDMMNYFPFIITYVLSRFASGLVIYWTFSAILSILQQAFIMRSLGVPIYLFDKSAAEEELEAAVEKGPAVHPLIEMAEEDAEEALFGEHDSSDDGPPKDIKPPKPKKKKKKK